MNNQIWTCTPMDDSEAAIEAIDCEMLINVARMNSKGESKVYVVRQKRSYNGVAALVWQGKVYRFDYYSSQDAPAMRG